MAPSLALLTLAALTPNRHDIIIANENIERLDYTLNVDLVAITVTVDVCNRAISIAQKFRKRGIPVVAGGIHITAVPTTVVDHFDAICVGPAERVWARILDDAASQTLQKMYRDDYCFRGDELVSPDYTAIASNGYLYTNVVSTSRGCPYHCDFCYNSCENSLRYVNRPVDDVIADIAAIGRGHIMFIDDNFVGNPAWTRDFLTRISGTGIKWNAAVTVSIVNHLDILDLMQESGCQSLFIGFESINPESISSVGKRHNNIGKYESLIHEIHSRGIMINASLVFGLPGDSPDVFATTLDWLIENRVETVTSHILTPYPGTALHSRMFTSHQITDFNLDHYNTAHVVFTPERMTSKELYDGYIWFYKKFYSVRNILRRIPFSSKQRIPYLLFNFLYRKYGRLTAFISRFIPLEILGRLAARLSYSVPITRPDDPIASVMRSDGRISLNARP